MRFYDTKPWRKKRKAILARDEHECRECKRYGRSREAKTVHHCNPIETHWEFRLKSWNLISLCYQCHELMHNREEHTLTELGEYWREKVTPKELYIPPGTSKIISQGTPAQGITVSLHGEISEKKGCEERGEEKCKKK